MNKQERAKLFKMFNGRCAYCGTDLSGLRWHVDHVKAIRRGNFGFCMFPELDTIENKFPACASCNINKHSMDIEEFRNLITGFMKHLNEISTQYKLAKRYGLVTETNKKVQFYFETIKQIQ